jgi:hypothetical protein
MLWYNIFKIKQACANDLCQWFILWKGPIKYKLNGINPMKTHIESTHPRLIVHINYQNES